ncbi:MAG: Diaminopimelate decarboxylase [Syntrophomonadaceae bacterium]|nr:Diaminopimelate decarboxylase [Bacillota bacterium]
MNGFKYIGGELYSEDVKVAEIAKEVGTPFYLYSSGALFNNYHEFEGAFSELNPLVCYAYKANSNLALCKVLAEAGCGADVVSEGELRKALQVGVPPEKIVFNGNGKTLRELNLALEHDILMFNVDSDEEMVSLNSTAAELRKKARISLRVNPDIDPKTHSHIATGLKESKFGFEISSAIESYHIANELGNLEVAGIHIHIGSQITSLEPFMDALEKIAPLLTKLEETGIELKYLNVGGGLGITYREEPPLLLSDYRQAIASLVKATGLKIIFEPGRRLVGNAGILITQVLSLKETPHKKFVVVDVGMNDLIRPAFYDAYHEIKTVKDEAAADGIVADVVGPLCECGDFLAKDREIPRVRGGDLLAIFSAGAYGFSMSSNYNSRCRAAEVLVKGDIFQVVRERETYEDLIRGERFFEN